MTAEQFHIHSVRFPSDVKHIAENRNGAHSHVNGDVPDHPCDQPARGSEPSCFTDQPHGNTAADEITDTGYQTDDRIQTKLDICSRNAKLTIEKLGDSPQLFDFLMLFRINNKFRFDCPSLYHFALSNTVL